ncbi:hypothetical protein [Spirillospora sp. NBC_01491]|uniref:hypothetical protein n=1 Tax=Spirillospora sp. NBC_01491 TaxID=2976007 RepID=UPI002E36DFF7|nr:hypothetical protein [Spirillospora sp. NBC_01491]
MTGRTDAATTVLNDAVRDLDGPRYGAETRTPPAGIAERTDDLEARRAHSPARARALPN